MKSPIPQYINVAELRIGHYVEVDTDWLSHPFPAGGFRITSQQQIELLRGMGLKKVRYIPTKSELPPSPASGVISARKTTGVPTEADIERRLRAEQLERQQQSLKRCEQKFEAAQQSYLRVQDRVQDDPKLVYTECLALVRKTVDDMTCEGECVIRLLSEGMGERLATHPVNVAVLSLFLGRAMGLSGEALVELGLAAFLHDIGKLQLPKHVQWFQEGMSPEEVRQFQDHVNKSVAIGNRLGLSEGALMAIAQHHELMDRNGFPMRPRPEELTQAARILALVNRYDNLCNPPQQAAALTPHEALSQLFTQLKAGFDPLTLNAFIRLMGVYPPGSIVQLADGRYALVVSVNAMRPLKPRVIVHDPQTPRQEALILDLETQPQTGIRRSLKPAALPREVHDYLRPGARLAWYFEDAGTPPEEGSAL